MNLSNNPLWSKIPNWRIMLQLAGNRGIVRNVPFLFYCSFLGIIYITMNHYSENTIRRINETAKDLKECRWKYIDEKSQFMFLTKESQLEKGAMAMGLGKTKVPPHKIIIQATSENEQ